MKYLLPLLALFSIAFCAYEPNQHEAAGSQLPTTIITPSAGPSVENGIDVFITGSFIYWTSRSENLAYAKTGRGAILGPVPKGTTKYPNWDWDPGFKAGLGLNLPHDQWDAYAEFTWLHSNATASTSRNDTSFLTPTWSIATDDNLNAVQSTTAASGAWNLHFYTVDLSLGRNYFISRALKLRPFIGFKGAWIDQTYTVEYTVETPTIDSLLKMKNDQDYWGLGLRSGIDSAWQYDTAWSVYGKLALSALWSQFQIERKDTRNDSKNPGGTGQPPLNTTLTTYNLDNDFHTIKGVLELEIGLRGEWWLFENRYHFLIQAGWEEQLWINNNQLEKADYIQTNHGDLILQGLSVKMRFDF